MTAPDHKAAVVLNAALTEAEALVRNGAGPGTVISAIRARISAEPRTVLKAVDIVDPLTFGPAKGDIGIMVSAQFGDVLSIDQREVRKWAANPSKPGAIPSPRSQK